MSNKGSEIRIYFDGADYSIEESPASDYLSDRAMQFEKTEELCCLIGRYEAHLEEGKALHDELRRRWEERLYEVHPEVRPAAR